MYVVFIKSLSETFLSVTQEMRSQRCWFTSPKDTQVGTTHNSSYEIYASCICSETHLICRDSGRQQCCSSGLALCPGTLELPAECLHLNVSTPFTSLSHRGVTACWELYMYSYVCEGNINQKGQVVTWEHILCVLLKGCFHGMDSSQATFEGMSPHKLVPMSVPLWCVLARCLHLSPVLVIK